MIPDLLYRLGSVALVFVGLAAFAVLIKLTKGDINSGR